MLGSGLTMVDLAISVPEGLVAASNGALPLRRSPSASATRTAPAVVTELNCSAVPVASPSAARSRKMAAR